MGESISYLACAIFIKATQLQYTSSTVELPKRRSKYGS